ncbi:Sodium/hydrogen exchanger family-domain-containing protein, partial [Blyttiomyces helicus]
AAAAASAAALSASQAAAAAAQDGSILAGNNPLTDPVGLFVIQLVLVLVVSRAVSYPLSFLNIPRQVAEVVAGILLGPAVLSKWTGFQSNIWPTAGLALFKLVADLGLILFLFLVGLELDPKNLTKNIRVGLPVAVAGRLLPFGAAAGLAKSLYDNYGVPAQTVTEALALQNVYTVPLAPFLVFIAAVCSITAFPILARILTERQLLQTKIGQTAIAAAALDDMVGWCLLAFVVALINNTADYINALWIFLSIVAFGFLLWFVVRPILLRIIEVGASSDPVGQFLVLAIFALVILSAWFTQSVGSHAIFGAFLVGLITPHEHGFAIQLAEKLEDLVTILLLPLFFVYTGLKTRVDQLDDGTAWGLVFAVVAVATAGKVIGAALASKLNGLDNRESLAVGFLLNSKGLLELIIMNLGLQAQIINAKVFTILVMSTILITLLNLVVLHLLHPVGKFAIRGTEVQIAANDSERDAKSSNIDALNVLVCLPNMSTVPALMALTQMMNRAHPLTLSALRLIQLSDRTSTVMMATDTSETMAADPVLNVFRTFGILNRVAVTPLLAVSQLDDFSDGIVGAAVDSESNLIIVPWQPKALGEPEGAAGEDDGEMVRSHELIHGILASAPCSVAVLVDRGFAAPKSTSEPSPASTVERLSQELRVDTKPTPPSSKKRPQRVFLPFFGGPDDREALRFASYLAVHRNVAIDVL